MVKIRAPVPEYREGLPQRLQTAGIDFRVDALLGVVGPGQEPAGGVEDGGAAAADLSAGGAAGIAAHNEDLIFKNCGEIVRG